MKGERIIKIIGWIVLGLCIAGVLGLLLGLVVQALWNWLMPLLFKLPEITYWQAVGLFILCHLLFKSHTGHGRHDHEDKENCGFGDRIASRVRESVRKHIHETDDETGEPAAPTEN